MSKLGPIYWKDFDRFLVYIGCKLVREKGDHRMYSRVGLLRPIVIPKDKAIPMFIIRNNLRVLSMTTEQYLDILDRL